MNETRGIEGPVAENRATPDSIAESRHLHAPRAEARSLAVPKDPVGAIAPFIDGAFPAFTKPPSAERKPLTEDEKVRHSVESRLEIDVITAATILYFGSAIFAGAFPPLLLVIGAFIAGRSLRMTMHKDTTDGRIERVASLLLGVGIAIAALFMATNPITIAIAALIALGAGIITTPAVGRLWGKALAYFGLGPFATPRA
jgi:hypothetical protein